MKNKILEKGDKVPYTNSTGATIEPGQLVNLGGGRVGFSVGRVINGASGLADVEGVFDAPKNSSVFSQGEIPAVNSAGTTFIQDTSATTTIANGWVWEAANSAATTVLIKLNG